MVLKVWNFYKYLLKLLYIFFKIPWVGWAWDGEKVGRWWEQRKKNKNKNKSCKAYII